MSVRTMFVGGGGCGAGIPPMSTNEISGLSPRSHEQQSKPATLSRRCHSPARRFARFTPRDWRLNLYPRSRMPKIEKNPPMKQLREIPRLDAVSLLLCLVSATSAGAATSSPVISTSNVQLGLSAGGSAPRLSWLQGSPGYRLGNRAEEQLPVTVELNEVMVPLTWQHKRELDRAEKHHLVLVYESLQPHLRLSWEWEARADFGPVEHRITVENLSGREIWLPMIDSLRLDLETSEKTELQNFYV